MPMKWVEPEILVEVDLDGKKYPVYHTYKNDEFDNRRTYWFSLDVHQDAEQFDVRGLPNPTSLNDACMDDQLVIIRDAFLKGLLWRYLPPELRPCKCQRVPAIAQS